MPYVIPTGTGQPDSSTLGPDDMVRIHYLNKKCFGLDGDEVSSCFDTYSGLWHLQKIAISWGPIVLLGFLIAILVFRHRAGIEDAFVNCVAGVIKGKRRVGNHFADVKSRIADKANE